MADKGTLESIEKLKAARPRQLLDLIDALVATQQNFSTTQEGLVAGLRFLVGDFRHQADLVMDSGARGKGAEATALRSTASALSLLADAVEQVTLDGSGEVLPVPSRGGPKWPAEWCGESHEHGPHVWEAHQGTAGHVTRECTGHHERDLTGLRRLVTDSAGRQHTLTPAADGSLASDPIPAQRVNGVQIIGPVTMDPGAQTTVLNPPITVEPGAAAIAFTFADPAGAFTSAVAGAMEAEQRAPLRRDGELEAYLSGETDTMPPIRNHRESIEPAEDLGVFGVDEREPIFTPEQSTAFVTPRTNTPKLKAEAAAMFADPKPSPAVPVMPGRKLSWAELRKAPAGELPAHLSFSQGGTLDECPLQYRLQRLEPGVVSRPRWANVGGKALHAAAEWFERQVSKAPGSAEYARARIEIAGGIGKIWAEYFRDALVEQQLETPSVPPADWKAGGRGQSEGWTWWQVEGEDMLRRYLDGRLADMDSERVLVVAGALDGSALIEHEGQLLVEGVPVKVVIDQVWRGETFGLEQDSLVVDDLKSGAYAPKGSYQLGLYAWYLRQQQNFQGKIYGRFWDARKGTYSDPVDLLELHPWDEIVLRVHGQHAKKQAGIFAPAPDWQRCGSCSVKHACPAALTRG